MDSKSSFSDLGQEFKDDMNIDPEVASINSPIYTPSHYHSPTYTTRVLLETPPPPTVSRPPLDRFATTRKSPTYLSTQERPPLDRFATKRKSPTYLPPPPPEPDRFATTSPSSLSSLPLLPPPMDHLTVTSPSEDTTKQNTKKTGGRTKTLPLTQYGGNKKTRKILKYKKGGMNPQTPEEMRQRVLRDAEASVIAQQIAERERNLARRRANDDRRRSIITAQRCLRSIEDIDKHLELLQLRRREMPMLARGDGRTIDALERRRLELIREGWPDRWPDNSYRIARRLRRTAAASAQDDDEAPWLTKASLPQSFFEALENDLPAAEEVDLTIPPAPTPPVPPVPPVPPIPPVARDEVVPAEEVDRRIPPEPETTEPKKPKGLVDSVRDFFGKKKGKDGKAPGEDAETEDKNIDELDEEVKKIMMKYDSDPVSAAMRAETEDKNIDELDEDELDEQVKKIMMKYDSDPEGDMESAAPSPHTQLNRRRGGAGNKKTRRLRRYNKRTLTKDKQDEEELDEMECIARYPYNDESAERMKDCLKN